MSDQSAASCDFSAASAPRKRFTITTIAGVLTFEETYEAVEDKTLPRKVPEQAEELTSLGIDERYTILEEIGHGSFGTVFKGEDTESGNCSFRTKLPRCQSVFRRVSSYKVGVW